jgi:transposase InsO family protein
MKRYIFTAIDYSTKVAFARMYRRANSYNATDFLNRLLYLMNGNIENIQTDNGSEFQKHFEKACQKLNLARYYNRPRTPKDNAVNERFNKTVQEEFINLGNFTPETDEFNRKLTDWLIEYNFQRPHQALQYQTPIKNPQVSTMYSSSTIH